MLKTKAMFEYIKKTYNILPEIGKEIIFQEKRKGVIVEDQGHYIGVNFYDSKPTIISSLHPTCEIKYLDTFGKIRKLTPAQKRYQSYLNSDSGLSFMEWLTGRSNKIV